MYGKHRSFDGNSIAEVAVRPALAAGAIIKPKMGKPMQRLLAEIVYFSCFRLKYRLITAASEVPTMSRNEIALITGVLPSRTWR